MTARSMLSVKPHTELEVIWPLFISDRATGALATEISLVRRIWRQRFEVLDGAGTRQLHKAFAFCMWASSLFA